MNHSGTWSWLVCSLLVPLTLSPLRQAGHGWGAESCDRPVMAASLNALAVAQASKVHCCRLPSERVARRSVQCGQAAWSTPLQDHKGIMEVIVVARKHFLPLEQYAPTQPKLSHTAIRAAVACRTCCIQLAACSVHSAVGLLWHC